jgi:gliding motility-associated-like protein
VITVSEPNDLNLVISITNILCHGDTTGSIDLAVSGGMPGYFYLWSNQSVSQNLSNLAAGLYHVVVTDDNGCSDSIVAQVIEPIEPLSGFVLTTPVSCFGGSDGSVEIICSGGTFPYNYIWSNGENDSISENLIPGNYSVQVSDGNGCNFTTNGDVTQPTDSIFIEGSVTDVSCFGFSNGVVDITVSGGSPDYIYQWSSGSDTEDLNGVPAGSYSVMVTDLNGCVSSSFQATIEGPFAPLEVNGISADLKCREEPEGSINLTVSGGTFPYQFVWSNGSNTEDIQGLYAGTYDVLVSDASGCTADTFSIVVSQPDQFLVVSGSLYDVTCFGESNGGVDLTVTGGTPGYTYSWTNGSFLPDLSSVPPGVYTVTVQDQAECIRTATFEIIQPPQLFINGNVIDNSCFENSDGIIDITVSGGVPAYEFLWSTGASSEDLVNIPAGFYTVVVADMNGCEEAANFSVFAPAPLNVTSDTAYSIFIGESVLISAEVYGGTTPYYFQWTPEESLICPTCQSTLASPLQNTLYHVSINDANNCLINDLVFVEVIQDIFIPNSFTPGIDQINDLFKPIVRMAKKGSFQIFDRWGELIFSTENLDEGWDGTYQGDLVKMDVYVYRVDVTFYNGIEKTIIGNVNVLR